MPEPPRFPDFKPLELEDRPRLHPALWDFQPVTSELTFTNLYIWRRHYGIRWCLADGWLLVLYAAHPRGACLLEPIGPPGRAEVARRALAWLAGPGGSPDARLERAGTALADELGAAGGFALEPTREHFDYVYSAPELIGLPGKKFHAKRNHLARFLREHAARFLPLGPELVPACLAVAERWCDLRACAEDVGLDSEWQAVRDLLEHVQALEVRGGALEVDGRIEAFGLGELLNARTAVIHVEKADPGVPGMYAAVHQQHLERVWGGVELVNREQDLGEEGLRKAKESYHPVRLEPKHRVRLS
jgi:uncharacterized protein